jgi:E-phenylitaconyl-CoA hydratase
VGLDFEVVDQHIAVLTMNRPQALNAMDLELYQELSRAWERFRDTPELRVAVITGAGEKSFSTGADIKSFLTLKPEQYEFWLTQKDLLLNRGLEIWKPVIAAVNGYCLGGGMTLLLGTDIRVAADHARFGLSEVKRGALPGNGGTQRVLSQLPYCTAMEFLLTGDMVGAAAAKEMGLVNKVVPMADLMPTAMDYARRIAANAPLAVQATKELAVRSRGMHLNDGLRMEQAMSRVLMTTEDYVEGPKAFAEKREPQWKGK